MSMDPEDVGRSAKRFKYQSYNETLKDVHLPPALEQSQFDHTIGDNESHFHQAINHWKQLNLSPAFLKFANQTDVLSASMPSLLHHWKEIIELWLSALNLADDEALKALLDLIQKLCHDIRTTLLPSYEDILSNLVALLPQRISADAMIALIASLSALFKHVLVPSGGHQLIQRTWASFRGIIPRCNPEVQRAIAEVWGTSLRKFKLAARAEVVQLLVTDLIGIEHTSAWIFVFACKSVAQSLHTATRSILGPLLDCHLSREDNSLTYTLIRRVLTALIHHTKFAEHFSPIADLIIEHLNATSSDIIRLKNVLSLAVIVCSVRQGSRLSRPQLSQIISIYMSTTYNPVLHIDLLKLSTSALLASETSSWTGAARQVVEHSWKNNPELAVELSGSLFDLNWGGWKMIVAPQLLQNTWVALDTNENKILRLLAKLCQEGILHDVDVVWKERMSKWVGNRLTATNWERTETNVCALNDILTLSSILPTMSQMFNHILTETLEVADPLQDYYASPANSSIVLTICLRALANEKKVGPGLPGSQSLAWDIINKYGWSACVMESLVSAVNVNSQDTPLIPFELIYPHLRNSILSHSQPLRLSTLRFLGSSAMTFTSNERDVIRKCSQGEELIIGVEGVRERQLRISQISQVLRDGTHSSADIATRWLLAQLKVNLRPLWTEAIRALTTLSERFEDVVWDLSFSELQNLCQADKQPQVLPLWLSGFSDANDTDEVQEDERSWRDPSAHNMRVSITAWISNEVSKKDLVQMQNSKDRFDVMSYEVQLLTLLAACPSLAEKHNRELIPLFFSFVGVDAPSKPARQKLTPWLTLFSKFSNPKALYWTNKLQALYVTLLSHPDRALQRLALASLLTYKSPHLLPHKDTLSALLDDTRWRDELIALDISSIDNQGRQEYVDVLIRLLFGIMLEKRGRSRGGDRKAAIISALGGCRDEELEVLVKLMLDPFQTQTRRRNGDYAVCSLPSGLSEKQQIGYLTLLEDVLNNLGSRLVTYWPALLETTLDLLASAQDRINACATDKDGADSDVDVDVEEGSGNDLPQSKITRTIRQLGLKRLAQFFRCPVSFDFSPYMREMFRAIISPRLSSLDSENTQAPSALLELFYVWTWCPEYVVFLTDFDDRTLPKIYDCLVATNVKPAVISRIFDIVDRFLAFSSANETISTNVIKPHVSHLLSNLATLVGRTKDVASISNPLGQRQIFILSEIAQHLTDNNQASTLLGLFTPLLRRPSKIVPEKVKVDMIRIISNLFPLVPELQDQKSSVHTKTYALLSQLLQGLRARSARSVLISAFEAFSKLDPSLSSLVKLLESLNAYSTKRIEEPDFERRMEGFTKLNEELRSTLSSMQWLPILYNMLYFIQDPTELAIRTNASFALRSFIDITAQSDDKQWETMFLRVLYPGLKNGVRSRNEMVRTEVLGVIAHAVTQCQNIEILREMCGLLADGDEEANFFNNIHHAQIHRRTRALRRLAEYCIDGRLRSSTLAEVFVPLVGNFIGATDSIDHHLVNEAIISTGRMAGHLAWGAYYALIQYYLQQTKQKNASERVYVRAIVAILDNFHFQMDDLAENGEHEDGEEDEPEVEVEVVKNKDSSARIADAVNSRLIPALLQHLEKRDENEDTIRIPISVGVVNVAKHLPKHSRETQISRLLTILSQVFRSKSQETRDLARDTLCRIVVNLGPSYLAHTIRELRTALLRGPHLHVLAVVTHALLVHVTNAEHTEVFSVLDSCVEDVAHISAEVIFGQSGKDVQSEGFKTKMREVRSSSSKGLDSFAFMAKHITPIKISSLLHPIRSILQETEILKVLQQADDVLRRIAGGLNSNKNLIPLELLSLCHTLINQNSRFLHDSVRTKPSKKNKGSAIVQLKRSAPAMSDHYANNSFRFIIFGLDLFNTAYRRSRFDFQDPQIMARLESMVTVIGNTLYSQNAAVTIVGLKAAASIVKCPLKSVSKALPVFVGQIISIIKETGSTESEVVQTAFKSLAVILRDHPDAQMKEKDLVFLLELVSPDLEEPSRQASVFTVLRAIIARKFVVPEIYDLMDKVSEIMVTTQSSQVQELCRGALLQFLLDYPQGKNRLRTQMTFFAKNLTYVYESGRKSVMELLGAIVVKFEPGLVQEYGDLLFVALVMVIANDESAKCREMAAELIKSLYPRLDDSHQNVLLSHLHTWASQISHLPLIRVACQVYGLIVDVQQKQAESWIDVPLSDLDSVLQRSAQFDETVAEIKTELDLDWQAPYQALLVISKVFGVFPDLIRRDGVVNWAAIVTHLLYSHAWVRTAACRLVGTLFTAVPARAPENTSSVDTDSPSLFSTAWMEDIAKKMCLQLKSEHLDETLSLQIVKNLFYIGKSFSALPISSDPQADDECEVNLDDDEEEGEIEDTKGRYPLRWMFSKLSFQARFAHTARRNKSAVPHNWWHQPSSILKWFAAMSTYLDASTLEMFLVHILSPVYRIVEDDTIRDPHMDDLKSTAVELQDLVQTKVGSVKFANVYNNIRQGVLSVRRERRTERVLQVSTHPEMAAKRRIQRNVVKKESRKRKKDGIFAERKGHLKRRKKEEL